MGGPNAESDAAKAEIYAELQLRGKSSEEAELMVELARQIGQHISPMVCMDVDDLAYGIADQEKSGLMETKEKDRVLEFVRAHMDAPREVRKQPPPSDDWPGPSFSYVMGSFIRSIFRRH
jgi:hypothetical protein